jgi:PAS domain S-box-containing protein
MDFTKDSKSNVHGLFTKCQDLDRAGCSLCALISQVPAMIWVEDTSGKIYFLGDQFYTLTGLHKEHDDGYCFSEAIHPDDRTMCRQLIADAREGGQAADAEIRLRAAGNFYRWYLIRCLRITSENNEVLVIGINFDIDDRKQSQLMAEASEAEMRTLAELMPQLVSIADASGRTIYGNQRLYDFVGRNREDDRGFLWMETIHPEDVALVLPQLSERRVWSSGQLWQMEMRYRSGSGKYHWHLVRAAASDDGEKFFVTATDIDEHKQALEALRQSEEQFRTLVEAIPQIVWSCDPRGEIVFINRRQIEFTGLTEQQIIEGGWQLLMHPDDYEKYASEWENSLSTGVTFECIFRLKRAMGIRSARPNQYRKFLSRAVAMRSPGGAIVSWFGTTTDIEGTPFL